MLKSYYNLLRKNFFVYVSIILFSNYSLSQDIQTNLADEFLDGLPASVRDQIEVQNDIQEEKDIEDLFRSDTSLEKNKIILEKLKDQLKAIDQRFKNESDKGDSNTLQVFGSQFFQSLQSSFMPINVPNLGPNYIVDIGDQFKLLLTGKMSELLELTVQRDGSILIPDFGKVNIAGKSLSAAEEIIKVYINESSVGVTSFLTLSKVRDVQILMLGGVESPGIYTVSGGSSILSVLNDNKAQILEVPKNVIIKIGDKVVTSGFSDIYPPGLPVGTVEGVYEDRSSFQKVVNVRLPNDMTAFQYVFVITEKLYEME